MSQSQLSGTVDESVKDTFADLDERFRTDGTVMCLLDSIEEESGNVVLTFDGPKGDKRVRTPYPRTRYDDCTLNRMLNYAGGGYQTPQVLIDREFPFTYEDGNLELDLEPVEGPTPPLRERLKSKAWANTVGRITLLFDRSYGSTWFKLWTYFGSFIVFPIAGLSWVWVETAHNPNVDEPRYGVGFVLYLIASVIWFFVMSIVLEVLIDVPWVA